MLKQLLLITVFNCTITAANGQETNTSELFLQLKYQDSIFFEKAFNLCDFSYLKSTIHPDLIFFHDQIGIQNKADFLYNTKQNICSNPDIKPIRKVDTSSLEVFPLYNNGNLYGAIQRGVHNFYIREHNKSDRFTSSAMFTHVWLLENGNWLLKEVISFNHQNNETYIQKNNFENDIKQLMQVENVPTLGIGIIEEGQLKKIEVYGSINKETPAPYNSIFKVASLTKPITALVALKLVSNGKLGLDEALDVYWTDPDLIDDIRTKKLTPRIILSHQTGFPNWRYLTESKTLKFEFEPGSKFQYSGEGFEYLRKALEKKFKKSLEELARELVFGPAKMKDTYFWWENSLDEKRYVNNYDADGKIIDTVRYYEANAAANLLTTIEDYGNFISYILNGAGLSKPVLYEMQRNQVQLRENDFFGLGWEKLTGFSNDEYALIHTGKDPGVNTIAIIFPKSKNAWLIFMNGDNDMKIIEKLLLEKMYLGKELWNRR